MAIPYSTELEGTMCVRTSEDVDRAFRYRSGRTVNKFGFVRYRNWHLYAERGLVGHPIVVWLCGSHVLIERQGEPLSQ